MEVKEFRGYSTLGEYIIIEDVTKSGMFLLNPDNDYAATLGYDGDGLEVSRIALSLMAYNGDNAAVICQSNELIKVMAEKLECDMQELIDFITDSVVKEYLFNHRELEDELIREALFDIVYKFKN